MKHPTKPSTYIPGHPNRNHLIAWLVVFLGVAILLTLVLMIFSTGF